jgi:hypothetical protein
MLLAMAFSGALVLATILIHYEALRVTSEHLSDLPIPRRLRILVVVVAVFAAHTVEVWLYGLGYWLFSGHFGVGELRGAGAVASFTDCIYFSAVTFSTVGFGDLTPHGALRLIAGVEGLNGLVLITWSASFTYFAMEKYWEK